MLGSIIGDIVGSVYEFNNLKSKDFSFFSKNAAYTDDSILTIATADWIMNGGQPGAYYARYGLRHQCPRGGYGGGFKHWLITGAETGQFEPYNSCGNGSAMRVGPVGWAFDTVEEVLQVACLSAACTHNHPEGIKGAQATALAILLARQGASKEVVRDELERRFGYDLRQTCDQIRPTYEWGALCQNTVPQAVCAFLDSHSFEDAVRNAISLGGDSDTLACITGSIAEAYYGIPSDLRTQALAYLPDELRSVIVQFECKYGPSSDGKRA
ncbi:MAG: ADP-ribosylglycohydrolase family protein [Alloprevotella sp.]|nr:ADP-ribosylglycohydrolase family protein [Alloprevotella sp.]